MFFLLPTTNPILLAAAVIPAVVLLVLIYKEDRLEKEPVGLLLTLVGFGVLSTVVAIAGERAGFFVLDLLFEENTILYQFLGNFVVVALVEEGAKFWFLKKRTWNHPAFNCRFDGIVYAVFVSLGFALAENVGYVAMYGMETALLRAVTAIPAHASFAVFMGAGYGMAKHAENAGSADKAKSLRKSGLIHAALLHGAYDFSASVKLRHMEWLFLAVVVIMFISAYVTIKKISVKDDYI